MLGRFLEFSIDAPDIRASLEFYSGLGFTQAVVGEAWPHPYAVVTDGRICVGLHQDGSTSPLLTFVRPQLLKCLDELGDLHIEFETRRLGNDVFNEAAWPDPSGHLIRLVEARTFSPVKRGTAAGSQCGYFLEIALPAPDLGQAKAYWERLGFVGVEDSGPPVPHVCCTSDTIDIGLYDPQVVPRPMLLFETDQLDARIEALEQSGVRRSGNQPAALRAAGCALFIAPEGTPILMTENRPA